MIKNPVNAPQKDFNELWKLGGGPKGGPVWPKLLDLLRHAGQSLNARGYNEVKTHLEAFPEANPWHVCFALGISWGHLAKAELEFTEAVLNALDSLEDKYLKITGKFSFERGPEPIINSIKGGYTLFKTVKLPDKIPTSLDSLARAQERWLSPIISNKPRPRYIGSWNATAMFMIALFSQPDLARTQRSPKPILPPGGPITEGLALLHEAGLLSRAPDVTGLDDEGFEPGVLYNNNGLLEEICSKAQGWSLVDVHSGVYILGTKHQHSQSWLNG